LNLTVLNHSNNSLTDQAGTELTTDSLNCESFCRYVQMKNICFITIYTEWFCNLAFQKSNFALKCINFRSQWPTVFLWIFLVWIPEPHYSGITSIKFPTKSVSDTQE